MSAQNLSDFERTLGYSFTDAALLKMALTHPSVAHESGPGSAVPHNQRLEFLGDAVLQLVLTRELYMKFPTYGEGPLTKARAQLVNRRMLAEHGKRLGIGLFLQLSRGEEMSGGRERQSSSRASSARSASSSPTAAAFTRSRDRASSSSC